MISTPAAGVILDARTEEELQPPCEITSVNGCPIHGGHTNECTRPATWVLRTPCVCGTTETILICQPHAEAVRADGDCVVICTACGAPTPPDRVHLEPI